MILLDFNVYGGTESAFSIKDVAGFLSPIIVIITFIINQNRTNKSASEERRRTWYFKAYFEASITKIDIFFSASDTLVKAAIEALVSEKADKKTEVTAKALEEFSDLKRKFLLEVVQVLEASYPTIFSGMESQLLDLEDDVTYAISVYDVKKDDYFALIEKLYACKSFMIKVLSEPALGKPQNKA